MISIPQVSLGELLTLERRPVALIPDQMYAEIGTYSFGRGIFHKTPRTGAEVGDKKLFVIKDGDFILQITFAWEGAVALASKFEDGMYGSVRFLTFRVNEARCYPPYLVNYFRTHAGLGQLGKISPGSAGRNRVLSVKRIPEVLVPLPPLPEQKRIVSKIEELSGKIEEARGLRHKAMEEADALALSNAEVVFQRLAKRYGIATLGEVCTSLTDGDHITPPFMEDGVRFIFVGNVSSGRLHFENCKRVTEDYFRALKPQRVPQCDDILYSAVGATLGVPAIVDSDVPFCFQRHIAILRPDHARIDSRFGWHMLRSRTVFNQAWSSTTGSAQPTVPLRAIRQLPLPIPPISEQRRIVAYLDDLQAKVDSLKKLQEDTAEELNALMPSILSRAFSGNL